MLGKRKSAFSVYADAKPPGQENGHEEPKNSNKLKKQNVNNVTRVISNTQQPKQFVKLEEAFGNHIGMRINKKDSKQSHNAHENNGLSKIGKKNNKKSKKEKKKFAKLDPQNFVESLNLYNQTNDVKKKYQNKNKTNGADSLKNQDRIDSDELMKILNKHSALKHVVSKKELANGKDLEDMDEDEMFDSRKEAIKLFKNIISPVKVKDFFSQYWEKKPLLIKRNGDKYYHDWFSCKEFDNILRNNNLEFTTNVDITTYRNDVKENHNPEGRAYAPLVWDYFQQGCSIRLLNPQSYSYNVWKHLSVLQELFGTNVGANTYLTPAGTQGFAPHYDDIEAFVLQLEGKKRWRVYQPLNPQEVLPRFSSPNYSQKDLPDPIIDVILETGDLLYFPRGFIHQANACDDIHSLHITVSCYQKNSYGDFLQKLLPGAIEVALQENVEFRRGLPLNYLINNGVAYEDDKTKTKDRAEFTKKVTNLIKKLADYAPVDAAVDQMGKQFIHDSLPPCFTEGEKARSIHGHGESWNERKNKVDNISEIDPDTSIKIIRRNCIRLIVEEDSCRVYHNLDNSKIFREKDAQYLEVEAEAAPAIEFLIKAYPKYVTVDELPMDDIEEKLSVARSLYDKGLLVTGEPLECDYANESDTDEYSDDEADSKIYIQQDSDSDDDDENKNDQDLSDDSENESNQNGKINNRYVKLPDPSSDDENVDADNDDDDQDDSEDNDDDDEDDQDEDIQEDNEY